MSASVTTICTNINVTTHSGWPARYCSSPGMAEENNVMLGEVAQHNHRAQRPASSVDPPSCFVSTWM